MSGRVSFVGFVNAPVRITDDSITLTSSKKGAEYKFRPFEGIGNNLSNPSWGMVGRHLRRKANAAYDDATELSLHDNPNARTVSNVICKQTTSVPSPSGLSNLWWGWAQFIDHALDKTSNQSGESAETLVVPVPSPTEDPEEDFFFPGRTITITRSKYIEVDGVRQHPNELTSYMDACNVYGLDSNWAYNLRRVDGTGKLKTSMADNGEDLLPYNTFGFVMDTPFPVPQQSLFAAGDTRANENLVLLGIHTIFVREHNRLCDEIIKRRPEWSGNDELIFQHARRIIIGLQQHITFEEVLPKLLGPLPSYAGYLSGVDTSIFTEFSTVGYRVGHTMLPELLQIGANPENTMTLFQAFFNPSWAQANGLDQILYGQSQTVMQKIDNQVVNSVRNQLFGPPTTTSMLDLATLNIMRGRDHGIPGYNAVRMAYSLNPISTWDAFPTTPELRTKLSSIYASPDVVDPWIGMLCENHMEGKQVGPLLFTIIMDQAMRIRSGDRFWYENDDALSYDEKLEIKNTKFSHILNRNTAASITFQDDVFVAPPQ